MDRKCGFSFLRNPSKNTYRFWRLSRFNGTVLGWDPEVPRHNRYGTIKNPHSSMSISAEQRPEFCSTSQAMATSLYEMGRKTIKSINLTHNGESYLPLRSEVAVSPSQLDDLVPHSDVLGHLFMLIIQKKVFRDGESERHINTQYWHIHFNMNYLTHAFFNVKSYRYTRRQGLEFLWSRRADVISM